MWEGTSWRSKKYGNDDYYTRGVVGWEGWVERMSRKSLSLVFGLGG